MTEIASPVAMDEPKSHRVIDGTARFVVIATMAFLTVVDLFAAQALLPTLVARYGVSPAAMGLAVNACTFGMAAAGLSVALFSRHIDRRAGIVLSLALLTIPTALLAQAPNLAVFATLRVIQGVCMATAFSLTLAHLGEHYSAKQAASAFAAYITGNVASNLIGRLIATGVTDHFGLASAFYTFAALNLAGAGLAYMAIPAQRHPMPAGMPVEDAMQGWLAHLRHPSLRAGFGIGFCILFAFIGTFTFVNFILVAPPLSVGMMELGVIYFVFLPSILTTPLAGAVAGKLGTRNALLGGLAAAALGLPLLLSPRLVAGALRHGARGRGHVLRAGAGHGIRQPRRAARPQRRQRHVSRQLLHWRPGRYRGARASLRPAGLAGNRRRHWCRPGRGRDPQLSPARQRHLADRLSGRRRRAPRPPR